ncbi:DUF3987 domain-containing protein [Amycolatopsis sp. NPDC004772]
MPATATLNETEERARAQVAHARKALPGLDSAVYDTYLGWITHQIAPTTEADPIGILASLLCAAGVHLGRSPHVRAGDDSHPLLVWPLIVGRTGGGRKGAGWGSARRVLTAADAEFMTVNVRSGLTSGEGLAAMFAADEDGPDDDGKRAPGALPPGDKRLLVFEAEWAGVMQRMKREGNSLSATLRNAWDGGDLSTLAVSARIAKDTHVGILGHITPKEFRAKVSASDLAGGTYNRFLPIAVAQCQFLPFSQGADPNLIERLGSELRERLTTGATFGTLGFTDDAVELWWRLYIELGGDHGDAEGGPVEEFSSRAAPNCLRIAGIHAALDGTSTIGVAHLTAAAALVRYSIASARAVFTDTSALAKLAAWIGAAGAEGRTRKAITAEYFRGNTPAAEVTTLLDQLKAAGQITVTTRPSASGRGRPSEVYTARAPDNPTNQTN